MRSKSTNFLQMAILISAILYIIFGLFLYFFPIFTFKLFGSNISENWLNLVKDHELITPLYFLMRTFAAFLLVGGLSLIIPLFDPLKFRILIYFDGILFPFLASLLLLKNSLFRIIFEKGEIFHGQEKDVSILVSHHVHYIVLFAAIVFSIVFFLNLIGLLMTKKLAKEGLE